MKDLLKISDAEKQALSDVFDKVANKENWKMPIDATVALTDAEIAILTDAVIFYAGCVPSVTKLGNGRYRVQAEGYYNAVGA
jgi:hypothetical protein